MHAPAITFEVANRFHSLRRRYLMARLLTCVAAAGAGLVFGWIALAILDYFWELPLLARRSLIVGLAVVVGTVALWETVRTANAARAGRFVGRLEGQFDLLGQRLRTLLETVEGRWRAPEAMLSALGHQTLGRWETVQPTQVIPRRLMAVAAGCAGLWAFVASAGYFAGGDDWRTAMQRALGTEVPYTRLVVSPGDARLLEGAELSVRLELHGRTDRECLLRYRNSAESEWTEMTLQPSAERTPRSAAFVGNLGKVSQSVEYQFITSVGNTRAYTITMQPLIEVKDFSIQVAPPEYTHLASRTFATSELSVLQGSQVSVTVKTNHPLDRVELRVGQSEKTLTAMDVEKGKDPRIWSFALPSNESIRWHFAGSGQDETPMKPLRGRLNVRPDQPPRLEWQEPLDELTVHMLAEVPMQVQVSDDYGISEAGIVFQLGDEEFVLKQWPGESGGQEPQPAEEIATRLRLEEVLPLESFGLSERDFVAYFAFAKDSRAGAPHRVESEVRYIDIRPLKQLYSERDANLPGRPGNGPPGLDEIIRRERFLINRTRSLARSPSASGPDRVGVIERMVEGQSELADLTRFLTEFLISQGNDDTEALSQAEAAMLQAADSLSSGNFDTALVQEQDALRFLAEARRTLEIILARNRTMQQRQAFNRFRSEMQQRLRRSQQTDAKLVDSLKQIAQQQLQLASSAEKLSHSQATASPQANASGPAPTQPPAAAPVGQSAPADRQPTDSGDSQEAGESAANANDEADASDPGEQLQVDQQELLDRLTEIDAGLSNDVKRSELVTERMQRAISAMDELVSDAEKKNWSAMPLNGKLLAGQLDELAMHIDALAQGEPAKRVAAVRDMTTALANMEGNLANTELSAAAAAEEKLTNAADADTAATDQRRAEAESLASRVQQRAETLADVLNQPVSAADVAGNEVYEQLQQLAEERQLAEKLAASRAAASEARSQKETAAWAEAAMNRATEYADVAAQLEGLYRQLVTPRLDNLRRLESKANALARLLDAELKGKGSGGEAANNNTDQRLPDKSAEMLQQELELELSAAGLQELADELADELREGEESESTDEESTAADDLESSLVEGDSSRRLFALSRLQNLRGRVIRIDRRLQEILHDLILSEISADQNMPVPPEYKELVDRYFRSISGGATATEVPK